MPERTTSFVAKRLTMGALNNITRLSEFRKFLTVNQEAIKAASGGHRISWARLLALPEIEAQKFRDTKGRPISSRLAARIWQDVLNTNESGAQGMNACEPSAMARPIEPTPTLPVMTAPTVVSAPNADLVRDKMMQDVMKDLIEMDPRTRRNAPEVARRITARLTREREPA